MKELSEVHLRTQDSVQEDVISPSTGGRSGSVTKGICQCSRHTENQMSCDLWVAETQPRDRKEAHG